MKSKPFAVPRQLVARAWKQVKEAKGAAGIDGVTIEAYEANLAGNLYKLWNRMSSGAYFPKPVRQVLIPKPNGGERTLGIPTVEDRVAQTVVKLQLEPRVERVFHGDSYGYRPGRSAKDAVAKCRERCFKRRWAIDLDLAKYFDSIPHDLLMKAVSKHATTKWEVLYIERWLKAGVVNPNGDTLPTEKGTPQGAVISPLLANLYLHYGFDKWMERDFPHIPFERYADDAIVHCTTEKQARFMLDKIAGRMTSVGLTLNLEKTKVVQCLTSGSAAVHGAARKFTFLGFDFRPRPALNRQGEKMTTFAPAVGTKAQQRLLEKVRRLRIQRFLPLKLRDMAAVVNTPVRGWINYFRHFRPSSMKKVFYRIDLKILRWLKGKYKLSRPASNRMLQRIKRAEPTLFVHWPFTLGKQMVSMGRAV